MSLTPRIDNLESNLIINGGLDFWQRYGATVSTFSAPSADLTADRIKSTNQGSTVKAYTVQRSSDIPSFAQSGFGASYSHLSTVTTLTASFSDAADLIAPFFHRLEGYEYARIHSQLITIGFWFKASQTGNYALCLNGKADFSRNYSTTFNVPVAGAWQFVSETIQLENISGYDFTINSGLEISIGGLSGTNFSTNTQNVWQSGPRYTVSGVVNWMATNAATIQVAMFSCIKGIGLSSTSFSRSGKSIVDELLLCQRYFEKSYDLDVALATPGSDAGSHVTLASAAGDTRGTNYFKSTKRTTPTAHSYSSTNGTIDKTDNNGTNRNATYTGVGVNSISVTSGGSTAGTDVRWQWSADAEL